jgi:tRNA threonylcarbamoyl adenosine modification protein YeaZ
MKPDISGIARPHHNLQIAFETSGLTGSIAVLRGETVLRETRLASGQRTAATLAPALAATLKWCREQENEPDFISIADGPGSFTGLRIGVTTAKTLSYACDLPLIAVDAVAAVAAATFFQEPQVERLLVGTNAYRGQVFMGLLDRAALLTGVEKSAGLADGGRRDVVSGSAHPEQVRVVDAEQWRQILASLPKDTHVTGDRVVFKQAAQLPYLQRTRADAVGVGLLAWRSAAVGGFTDPLQLTPRYLRPSAAEEKRAKLGK